MCVCVLCLSFFSGYVFVQTQIEQEVTLVVHVTNPTEASSPRSSSGHAAGAWIQARPREFRNPEALAHWPSKRAFLEGSLLGL